VSKCQRLDVQGCRGRGRPKKTWERSVKCDIRKYGMQRVEPFDKDKWRSCCGCNVQPVQAWKKDVINCLIDSLITEIVILTLQYRRQLPHLAVVCIADDS